MEFFVYILYSERISRYYVGHTDNVSGRIDEHNRGKGNYTSKGIPWTLITTFAKPTRAEAMKLELQIKKRGIRRYLEDNGICPSPEFGT
jgi:putative endonuclease